MGWPGALPADARGGQRAQGSTPRSSSLLKSSVRTTVPGRYQQNYLLFAAGKERCASLSTVKAMAFARPAVSAPIKSSDCRHSTERAEQTGGERLNWRGRAAARRFSNFLLVAPSYEPQQGGLGQGWQRGHGSSAHAAPGPRVGEGRGEKLGRKLCLSATCYSQIAAPNVSGLKILPASDSSRNLSWNPLLLTPTCAGVSKYNKQTEDDESKGVTRSSAIAKRVGPAAERVCLRGAIQVLQHEPSRARTALERARRRPAVAGTREKGKDRRDTAQRRHQPKETRSRRREAGSCSQQGSQI